MWGYEVGRTRWGEMKRDGLGWDGWGVVERDVGGVKWVGLSKEESCSRAVGCPQAAPASQTSSALRRAAAHIPLAQARSHSSRCHPIDRQLEPSLAKQSPAQSSTTQPSRAESSRDEPNPAQAGPTQPIPAQTDLPRVALPKLSCLAPSKSPHPTSPVPSPHLHSLPIPSLLLPLHLLAFGGSHRIIDRRDKRGTRFAAL